VLSRPSRPVGRIVRIPLHVDEAEIISATHTSKYQRENRPNARG
jgi:hypothetical protein